MHKFFKKQKKNTSEAKKKKNKRSFAGVKINNKVKEVNGKSQVARAVQG